MVCARLLGTSAILAFALGCHDGSSDSSTQDATLPYDGPSYDSPSFEMAAGDSGIPDILPCDGWVDAPDYDTLPDGGYAYPTLTCGTAPLVGFYVAINTGYCGATPPYMKLTSSLCAGTTLSVPRWGSGDGWRGSGFLTLASVPQFLTVTSSDDSTYSTLSSEFVPDAPLSGLTWFIDNVKSRSLPASALPPGFDSTTALVELSVRAVGGVGGTGPCGTIAGTTFALDSSSAAAHPEAKVYYFDGSVFSTTSPPEFVGVDIVLKPGSSGTEYVRVQGTKTGCTVPDTGRLPLAAGGITQGARTVKS